MPYTYRLNDLLTSTDVLEISEERPGSRSDLNGLG